MSDKKSSRDKRKSSKEPRSRVASSGKRDPKEALEYWTKERIESAKPVPLPEVDVEKDDSQDDENDNDKDDD